MAFSFLRSLVKHTLKYGGNALGGGVVPIGSIASAVYVEWSESGDKAVKGQVPGAAAQASVRTELEKIVQDTRAYRAQVDRLVAELGAGQTEAVRQAARSYLSQIPGRVQSSLRRPEERRQHLDRDAHRLVVRATQRTADKVQQPAHALLAHLRRDGIPSRAGDELSELVRYV